MIIHADQLRRRSIDELRNQHYNATITYFERVHSDLWIFRVRPDRGSYTYRPGQYTTLALGFWEDRVDQARDPGLEDRWDKLVRRSYSISDRILDDDGKLAPAGVASELEFYIVLVPPTSDIVPGLTPRLALKRPGDRLFLGSKAAGRYTLAPVESSADRVFFFATGTGEAPHNAMIRELLGRGHTGPIVAAVTVRRMDDLGYLDRYRELERRYDNFDYLPLATREPGIPKRYIQNLVEDDAFSTEFGVELDPSDTHVFMCGNPAMIGCPSEDRESGALTFPKPVGLVELLTRRGFTIGGRNRQGNLHFEEYW